MKNPITQALLASFMFMLAIVFLSSCGPKTTTEEPGFTDTTTIGVDTTLIAPDSVVVTKIERREEPVEVVITVQTNSTVGDAATGALLGAGASYLLGGSVTDGGVLGGTIGLATSNGNTTESYRKTIYNTMYDVYFNDGIMVTYPDKSPYKVGEKVAIWE